MLTLRAIPPRLLGPNRRSDAHDLAALYFDALWSHWSPASRMGALIVSGAAAIANLAAARSRTKAWRNGWTLREQALLAGGVDPLSHLSMAARKGVHRLLNPGAFPLASNPLKNKRLFAERCRHGGLPIPDAFEGDPAGIAEWVGAQGAIVAKPNYASKGEGVIGFRQIDGAWVSGGRSMSGDRLVSELQAMLRRGGVVQRGCDTHPDLAPISPSALPTLRVMTAIDETGAVAVFDRMVRLSAGGPRAVDNFNAGNIVAGIDPDGRIVRGYRRVGQAVAAVDLHPASGLPLTGWRVPDLGRAVALARQAHEVFRDGFRVIGWDVGLTASGPCLIEGNWSPGTDILALVSGRGLGDTRLGEVYRSHLQRLTAAEWRAARPVETEPRDTRPFARTATLRRSAGEAEDVRI